MRSLFLTGLRLRWFIKCQLKHVKGRCCVHLRCIKRGHCSTRNSFKYLECESTELHIISWRFLTRASMPRCCSRGPPSFSVLSFFSFSFIIYLFYAWIEAYIIMCFILLLLFLYNFLFSTPLFESRTFLALTFILTFLSRSTRPARRALTYV